MKNRTLLYGYCCVDGKITVHSGEAEIVAEIYKNYLDGKSMLAIAEYLNDRKIEYMPSVVGWNKARLKRMLEDERYIGNKQYPNLIDEETHNAVLSVKNTRNTQKDTDRKADIYQLPVPVLCGECHGKMKRLYNRRRKCKTSWKCENCGKTIDKEDDALLADMTVLVNTVITTPKIVKIPIATPVEPSMELRILNNEIARMMDSTDIKREEVRAKILQSLSQRYRELDNAPYTARRLVMELTAAEPLAAFNAEFVGKIANAAILYPNSTVSLILTNNQLIGKEDKDGTDHATPENSQSDTADGQYRRNSCP